MARRRHAPRIFNHVDEGSILTIDRSAQTDTFSKEPDNQSHLSIGPSQQLLDIYPGDLQVHSRAPNLAADSTGSCRTGESSQATGSK